MNEVLLPLGIANQMLSHAQSELSNEVCGLVSSRNGEVKSIYPIPNVASDPARLFQMDAKCQIDAMRKIRDNEEELYGIYHSHPASEAFPSAIDVEKAQYKDVYYFIISLSTEGVLDLRGYSFSGMEIEALHVEV